MASPRDIHLSRHGAAAERRLAALCAMGLLGAPTEGSFGRLTRLARRIFGTPVALLSFLDGGWQLFLGSQGLPGPLADLRETPPSHAFCRFVFEAGLPLSVSDARQDPLAARHPVVADMGIAACLAVPLSSPADGRVVGALCAIDRVPRAWSAEDEQALSDLAAAVTAEIAAGLHIHERRAAEAHARELRTELLHVSRRNAAGEAASALAHELDQPLTAATMAIGAARRMAAASLCSPDDGAEAAGEVGLALDLAAEQVLRAGHIVRRLRDFVSGGEADKRPTELRRLVEDACSLALAGAKERGVRATIRFGDALPPVFVDAIQIQQVVFNLVRNAVEAMATGPAGGEGAPSPRRDLVVSAVPAGPGAVEVAVADSGPGVAPEVAGRLFEAFVSTKRGGMGVGLSICRSIVEAHGGRIRAERNPGGGAVFRFTLPAAPQAEAGTRRRGGCEGGEGGWQPETSGHRRRRPERRPGAAAAVIP